MAEDPGRLLHDLQRVTDAALSYLRLDDLLDELLNRVKEILTVDTAAILLLDDDRELLVARAAKGLEEEVEAGVTIPVGRGFAGRIANQRRPIYIADVSKAEIYNPILRERGLKSLLGVPLLIEGDVIGVLHVGSLTGREFSEADCVLLERAADRAALAIWGQLTERERGLTEELQRALLPHDLPSFPGAELAARYSPAARAALGGDWYDAFITRAGLLCLTIGDVVGRGFRAAALMAQLRSALRAYALESQPPAQLLRQLNELIRQVAPGRSATIAYAVFDPRSRELDVIAAGNVPPLIVSTAGESRYVELPPSVPIGTMSYPDYAVVREVLEPGARLVMFTDGLVEDPAEPLEQGLDRLRHTAVEVGGPVDSYCGDVFDSLVSPEPRSDDAALIVLEASELGNPMSLRLPAERESAPLFRRVLSRWLAETGASEEESDAIVLACAEACANAIEHAYPPDRREFGFEARDDDGELSFTVRDWGTWRPPRGKNRGRGISMMQALTDSVEIDHGDEGTTVRLRHRLGKTDAA